MRQAAVILRQTDRQTDRQTEVTLSICHVQNRETVRRVRGNLCLWRGAFFVCPAPRRTEADAMS